MVLRRRQRQRMRAVDDGEEAHFLAREEFLEVTVDPVRDTPQVLRDYQMAFTQQMTGLYGDANALADVARHYRVAYSVRHKPFYEVMHSNAVFFFDRTGKARLVTLDSSRPAEMAADVTRLLRQQ